MENYELDENGFKKSKLSLDDLDKYTLENLSGKENWKNYNKTDIAKFRACNKTDKQKETSKVNIKKAQEVAKKSEKRMSAALENIKKGQKNAAIANKKYAKAKRDKVLADLNDIFNCKEAVLASEKNNLSGAWCFKFLLLDKESVEKIGRGKYKKIVK